ncbi:Phage head-tail joining protein [compost metagenome]
MTVRFKVRYRTDIHADMRIIDGGRVYNITVPLEDPYGNREETHLMAKEGPLNG